MADPTDFLDLPTAQSFEAKARKDLAIPDSFTAFRIVVTWERTSESLTIDRSRTEIVIEKSYLRLRGRCFRIDEYCVYEYRVRAITGTVVFRLKIDMDAVDRALRQAERLAKLAIRDELFDFIDPTSGLIGDTADLIVILARLFRELPIPAIFGDLADIIDLTQLLAMAERIAERVEAFRLELERLRALDGTVIERRRNVREVDFIDRVKALSTLTLTEVVCADFILALPEGEALRVYAHDEEIFPPPKLGKREGRARTESAMFRDSRDPAPLSRKALAAIRGARRPPRRVLGPIPLPAEVGGEDGGPAPTKAKARRKPAGKGAPARRR